MKGIYLETLFEVHVSILDPSGLFFLDGKKAEKTISNWSPELTHQPILFGLSTHIPKTSFQRTIFVKEVVHPVTTTCKHCGGAYNTSQWIFEVTSWHVFFYCQKHQFSLLLIAVVLFSGGPNQAQIKEIPFPVDAQNEVQPWMMGSGWDW